jgi:DNA polymerase III subunit gamma/tau
LKRESVKGDPVHLEGIDAGNKPSPISSHSLAAIKAKRTQLAESKKVGIVAEKRKNTISLEAVERELNAYAEQLEQLGHKILSSNFQLAKRELDTEKCELTLEVPNDTIKKELQMAAVDALDFLRDRLSNDLLHFKFKRSKEVISTEYAYTPDEKYQKLAEKYPQVEALRKHFNLDL